MPGPDYYPYLGSSHDWGVFGDIVGYLLLGLMILASLWLIKNTLKEAIEGEKGILETLWSLVIGVGCLVIFSLWAINMKNW